MARGNLATARRANDQLLPLTRAIYRSRYLDMHNRMETALHPPGKLSNPTPRPPLLPILQDERAAIGEALAVAGLAQAPSLAA
jgi:dihydrodipicolinate synthase/N-acetylneuraminate lyase